MALDSMFDVNESQLNGTDELTTISFSGVRSGEPSLFTYRDRIGLVHADRVGSE